MVVSLRRGSGVQLLRLDEVGSRPLIHQPVLVHDAEVVERGRVPLRRGLLVPERGGAVVHAHALAAVVQRPEVILSLGEPRVGGGSVPPRRDHRILRNRSQTFFVEMPEVTLRLPVRHVRGPLVVGERGLEVARRLRCRAHRVYCVGVSHRGASAEPTLRILRALAAPFTVAETDAEAVHRDRVAVWRFRSLQVQHERFPVGLAHEKFLVPHRAQLCAAVVGPGHRREPGGGRGTRAGHSRCPTRVPSSRLRHLGRRRVVVAALHRDASIPVG